MNSLVLSLTYMMCSSWLRDLLFAFLYLQGPAFMRALFDKQLSASYFLSLRLLLFALFSRSMISVNISVNYVSDDFFLQSSE